MKRGKEKEAKKEKEPLTWIEEGEERGEERREGGGQNGERFERRQRSRKRRARVERKRVVGDYKEGKRLILWFLN